METHPQHPDDLKVLERRLAAYAPSATGLDADAMLFAAGRASVRPSVTRFVWPALTLGLTTLALVLGVWLATERAERLELAQQLRQTLPPPLPNPSPSASPGDTPIERATEQEPAPNSLLAGHRALEKGLDAWPPQAVARAETPGPPSDAPVLKVGWRDTLLDP
jgi:hypothetical protein